MSSNPLPIGSFVRIVKSDLQAILDRLDELNYRVVGPRLSEEAIVFDDIDSVAQLPIGVIDQQDGGKYRLQKDSNAGYFDYVVGPHSLKNFLFPTRETVLECKRTNGKWRMQPPPPPDKPLAVIGVRSCDLHALQVQDQVFLEGPYVDPGYSARRNALFVVALNCRRAAATCFCHSMKTGPAVQSGFDLALTELDDYFVLEVGTEIGGDVVTATTWAPCSMNDIEQARKLSEDLTRDMRQRPATDALGGQEGRPRERYMDTTEIRDLLLNNLEHPRWEDVAKRCLACANCTMVCPTCFCSSIDDVPDLTGDDVRRERTWASCFTAEHSYMSTGPVRKTTLSRYRQWLTHKLATWVDQYGTSGCVGCGRCITWCPVGIDLTEEVNAIRGNN
jgi:ferredoxin